MHLTPDPPARVLNHVEMVHRPGERALAAKLFRFLGCDVTDGGGHWFGAKIDPAGSLFSSNVLYASEVTPAQWALEQALERQAKQGGAIAAEFQAYLDSLRARPQYSTHFGIRFPTRADWQAAVDRVRDCDDPDLRGRLRLSGVFHPGQPGAASPTLSQAFIHTDIIAAGLLLLGQHIELQVTAATKS